jgi:2-keto-3-deoxy-L-rhamnonate aldolase RhmA
MIETDKEYLDFNHIPQSKGVPNIVRIFATIGITGIFCVAAAAILNASYGHHWPSNQTQRVPLGNALPKQ